MLTEEEKEMFKPEYRNHATVFVHELDLTFAIVHHHVAGRCQNTLYQKCNYTESLFDLLGLTRNIYHTWDLCQN
jgi:hypothetical protein